MNSAAFPNKKLFLFGITFLFLFSLVSSQEDIKFLGTYKQYNEVTLTQTCDNCTYVNVTRVKFPNSVETYFFQAMTEMRKGNYNASFTNTSQLGNYIVTTCGNPDGSYACESYRLQVTTTGSDVLNTIPIFLLILGFCLFGLAIYKELPFLGFGGGIIISIAGVYFIIYGLGLFRDLYTQALGFTSLFIGLIIAFASAFEGFNK